VKFIIIIIASLFLVGTPCLMADTGQIYSKFFSSEADAVAEGKRLSREINSGKNTMANTDTRRHCPADPEPDVEAKIFQILTMWKVSGSSFKKRYRVHLMYAQMCTTHLERSSGDKR